MPCLTLGWICIVKYPFRTLNYMQQNNDTNPNLAFCFVSMTLLSFPEWSGSGQYGLHSYVVPFCKVERSGSSLLYVSGRVPKVGAMVQQNTKNNHHLRAESSGHLLDLSDKREEESPVPLYYSEKHSIERHVTTSAMRVNDPVPLQMVHQDKGFPTQRAAVRPLPAVCALVHPQTALLREPLPTLATAVRLLARVCPMVYAEVGRTLEVFAAHRAPESPLSLVALVVQLELVQPAKRLPTLRTDIAPCHSR